VGKSHYAGGYHRAKTVTTEHILKGKNTTRWTKKGEHFAKKYSKLKGHQTKRI
jgi:hypothetical protein